MIRQSNIILIFLLVGFCANGQENGKLLQGEVQVNNNKIVDVHIQNLSNNKATITDGLGSFKISVALNDTLLFTAVQLKRKMLIITALVLESSYITVLMEEFTNELDEVVLRPYNLSGDLKNDLRDLKIGPVISASTLKLPNANVKKFTQSENKLNDADNGKFVYYYVTAIVINLNKTLNRLSGRTKMLKERVKLDEKNGLTANAQKSIVDSLFVNELRIPTEKISDFMYYCEADSVFITLASGNDDLKLWDFLTKKSLDYRKNNYLD